MLKYSIRDFLNEAGNTPADIKWVKNNKGLFGNFKIKDQIFDIQVTKLDENKFDIFQFKFYRDDETKMFNDMKYAMGVVPTIKVALDYVMSNLKPDGLVFAASDESKTRKALYKLNAAKIATKYKYHDMTKDEKLKEFRFDSDVIFGVSRNKEILSNLLDNYITK